MLSCCLLIVANNFGKLTMKSKLKDVIPTLHHVREKDCNEIKAPKIAVIPNSIMEK